MDARRNNFFFEKTKKKKREIPNAGFSHSWLQESSRRIFTLISYVVVDGELEHVQRGLNSWLARPRKGA